jgi:hypothetical protein
MSDMRIQARRIPKYESPTKFIKCHLASQCCMPGITVKEGQPLYMTMLQPTEGHEGCKEE